jgi:hypothetical protein
LNPGIFGGDGLLNVAQLFVVQCSPCVGTLRFFACISGILCTFATVFDTVVALVLHSLVLSYLQWIMMYTLGSGAQELFYAFLFGLGRFLAGLLHGLARFWQGSRVLSPRNRSGHRTKDCSANGTGECGWHGREWMVREAGGREAWWPEGPFFF